MAAQCQVLGLGLGLVVHGLGLGLAGHGLGLGLGLVGHVLDSITDVNTCKVMKHIKYVTKVLSPITMKKYRSFSVNNLRLIQAPSSSLIIL